jgi:sterol desaturase/sphingolipid hydroxylase (fatty acid hydroxylase superfamily)
MSWLALAPFVTFLILLLGETVLPTLTIKFHYHRWDWLLNLLGFIMQGFVVPLCGYWLATHLLPLLWPAGKGILPLHWWGAFLLNFIVVDGLYYWQHTLFHRIPWLWQWHRCHHASPRVDVWATARNSLFINFFFVYMLLNPVLGYLCQSPAGFFVGATLTACLDLLRHCHHAALGKPANFGANLILWDKLFRTFCRKKAESLYRDPEAKSPWQQLVYPFKD